MDLKEYANQNLGDSKQDTKKDTKTKESGMNENDVRRAVKHFSGMNNSQLMAELTKHITAKRSRGEHADIESTIERIRPFLNEEQQVRMQEILGSLGK